MSPTLKTPSIAMVCSIHSIFSSNPGFLPYHGLFNWLLFGFFGRLGVEMGDFRNWLLTGHVLVAQNGGLLREIHVVHERHAALQS